jgi:hypothetical protein
MSKEVKIVLVALGSLAALLVLLVLLTYGAGVLVAKSALDNLARGSDPAHEASVAAKIAHFAVPAGYRYLSATDLGFVTMAIIVPRVRLDYSFAIDLEGMAVAAGNESDEELMQNTQRGLGSGASCKNSESIGQDRVTTASGKLVVLNVLQCTGDGRITEFGRIPAKMPVGIFMATGTPQAFDRNAVHALIKSIR